MDIVFDEKEQRRNDRQRDADAQAALEAEYERERLVVPVGRLISENPALHDPVIAGLIRRGEVANIISKSKVGKSWLTYGLALSIATGRPWLGFPCRMGRVLLIDNELHPATLAHRIPTVADAMGLRLKDYERNLDVVSLRGNIQPIGQLGFLFAECQDYDFISIDAMYRVMPDGASENDNAAMAQTYNLIDRYAMWTQAAFGLTHHSTKGNQSDKDVTDVGAGAGSQSRAADCHLVIRPHQDDCCAVLDAAVRSFAPVDPIVIRWEFPLWRVDEDADPTQLKREMSARDKRTQADREDAARKILAELIKRPAGGVKSEILRWTGLTRYRGEDVLNSLASEGRITAELTHIRGNETFHYRIAHYDEVGRC